ncbi:MAG TPA: aminotransferase class IV, partial [Pyrinomonadaceae bacterium]|nr:aminotransferase class IV [Pyrinomonadaceae bacterium]
FPLRLTISHEKISRNDGLSCFKLLDYTGPIAAFNKAENEGFDEAIRLNEEGEVVSGCLANIFWKYEGKLYTPPLESGCLAGTTREFLMERTGAIEKNASIEDLATAERIYLTSAGLGVAAACLTDANSFEPSDELLTLTPHFGVGKAS